MSAFIDERKEDFGVEPVCRTLGVSASAYYQRKTGERSARQVEDERLLARIREVHEANYCAYGYRRMWKALRRAGEDVGRGHVQRLMGQAGIQGAKRRGRPWRTTTPDPAAARRADLVNRDFTASRPNELWVSDFSYLRCWEGTVFFSFVIDVFSRKVVGWQFAGHMRTTLVLDALRMALSTRERVEEVRLVHHSDRGSKLDSTGPRNTLIVEVFMGRPAGWMRELTGRAPMKSPGHPTHRREVERLFWFEIAKGLSSDDAAVTVGASQAAGSRWFRERGGMPTFMLERPSGRYLSFPEREEIAILNSQGAGVREIARRLGRSPSTISRELRRNAATRGGKLEYRASVAQWKAELIARRPKTARLAANERLREYVQERLSGRVRRLDGTAVQGPATAPWRGRNKPHRQDRRWASAWSPEQISARLRVDFPDDESMRISHEAIYQALYVQGRGALRRELTACLRTGRALRVPRARTRARGKGYVSEQIMISARPAEAEDRAVPGHWEGDLILGANQSAIGTLVERSTRFTMLLHLPPMPGHGGPKVKNGPPLAGRGAEAVRDAITAQLATLPEQLCRSLTWDQGAEMTQHAQLTIDSGLQVYFCDPQSPWQRGTNENTNGLLRQYFPKGTNLARHTAEDLEAVATTLNSRPRKTLDWRTPAEALDQYLHSLQTQTVATTD